MYIQSMLFCPFLLLFLLTITIHLFLPLFFLRMDARNRK
jgi:F0F1-type ATP synthase assembly protein I